MMTCTVARLYDDYPTASKVVRELEAAGIARLEISIIASNLHGWYAEDDTGAGERDATADSAAPATRTSDKSTAAESTRPADRDRHDDQRTEGAFCWVGHSAQRSGLALACLPVWACCRYRGSAPSWAPDGSRRWPSGLWSGERPAASSVR